MRMALVDTGIGDTGELSIMQSLDGCGTTITHTRTQTTNHLIDHLLYGSLIRHTSCDTLWNKLLHILSVCLEVTVLRTVLHCLEGSHTTIALELTSVVDDGIARTLLRTCHERTDHHTTTTGSKSLHDISRVTQTTIGDKRHVSTLQCTVYIIYRTQLWHTHTGNDTSGTDTTRTDTDLHGVSTVVNEHLSCIAGSDVTYYDIDIGE